MSAWVLLLALACKSEPKVVEEACDACGGDCALDFHEATSANHVEGAVDYPISPPSSGDHWPCWAAWGPHDDDVAPEQWVHNLEHGGIVLLYTCPDGCDAERQQLLDYTNRQAQGTILLASSPGTATRFWAISWQNRLSLGCLDLTAIDDFYWAHLGQAPENLLSNPASTCMDTGSDTGA